VLEKLKDIANQDTQIELTRGEIGKPLLYLTFPVLITNLLQTAYNLVDTFWLGRVSTDALAAVGFVFPILFLFISAGIGLSIAGSIMVAKNEGSDDRESANRAASQTLLYTSFFSILIGLIGYISAEWVITFMGAEKEVIPLATSYLEIVSLGMILTFGFSVFKSLLRGYGDTFTPMVIMAGSVMLNMILDPLLIFGWSVFPELGIEGAAIATLISRGLAFCIGLYILFSGFKGLKISPRLMIPDIKMFTKTLKLGLPASVEIMTRALSVNAILFIVGMFTTPVVAAYGIVTRIYSAVYLPSIAVSRSVETMTAQNYGAEKMDRVVKTNKLAARYSFIVLAVFGAFCMIFANPILGLFTDNPDVIRIGSDFLLILGATFGFIGSKSAYNGGLRGLGKTSAAAVIALIALWFVRVPFAYFSIDFIGETGVWWAFAISNILGAVIAYHWFYSREMKKLL